MTRFVGFSRWAFTDSVTPSALRLPSPAPERIFTKPNPEPVGASADNLALDAAILAHVVAFPLLVIAVDTSLAELTHVDIECHDGTTSTARFRAGKTSQCALSILRCG
jgi:hypothetical protein